MANWSELPQELLVFIANRIGFIEDFIAFGAVCKSWRPAAAKENFNSPQVLLMLPKKYGSDIRECYSLRRDKIHTFNLPVAERKVHWWCSCLGWIISLRNLQVSLLSPACGAEIKLPDFRGANGQTGLQFKYGINKFALSSTPSWTSDFTVMVASGYRKLAFCRRGDDEYWTDIASHMHPMDLAYYKGQFYGVSHCGSVSLCDINDPRQARTRIVVQSMPWEVAEPAALERKRATSLVESAGDLLLVLSYHGRCQLPFRVFKVPLSDGNWQLDSEVKDLGSRTIFLGHNNSFSVEASNYAGCKRNCIYFFSYKICIRGAQEISKENIYMDIFNMKDGTVERHYGYPTFRKP